MKESPPNKFTLILMTAFMLLMATTGYAATLNLVTKYGKTGGLKGNLNNTDLSDRVNGRQICSAINDYNNAASGCDMSSDAGYNDNNTGDPSDDFYTGDLIVRTNDNFEVIAGWSWLGNPGGAEEEITLTGTLPPGTGFIFDGIPGACDQAASTLSPDRKTINCVRKSFDTNDVGSYAEDLAFAVRAEGDAENGSVPGDIIFSIDDPTNSGPMADGVRDGNDNNLIKITASPRWNIDKHGGAGYYTLRYGVEDDQGNAGFEIWYNFTIETDEVPGETEIGVNPFLGNEALKGGKNATITFTDDLSEISPNAKLVTWSSDNNFSPATNPCDMDTFTNSDEPYASYNATYPDRSIPVPAGGMTVTCTEEAGHTVSVTVTGIDGSLTDAPIKNRSGGLLPVTRKIAAIGLMRVFVPLDDVRAGNDGILGNDDDGELLTTNCINNFTPKGISGRDNFNGLQESENDNCYQTTLFGARGSWRKDFRKGWSDQADQREQWGGGSWALPPTDASIVWGGDGYITPEGVWGTYTIYNNTGGTAIGNPMLCDVIDRETYEMTILDPDADNPATFVDERLHAVDLNYGPTETVPGLTIEYATGYVGTWPPNPDEAPRTNAPDEVTLECGDPGITWYPDIPTALAAGNGPVTKVRVSAPELPPSDYIALRIKHTARRTFYTSGADIPNNTLLVNYAAYKSSLTDNNWNPNNYIPHDASTGHQGGVYGDRLTMIRAKARLLKTMEPAAVSPGSNATVTLIPSFTTDGAVPETDDITITDVLPAGLEYTVGTTNGSYGPANTPYGEPEVYPATDDNCNLYASDVVAAGYPCGSLNGGTGNETILVWTLSNQVTGTVYGHLVFDTLVTIDAPPGVMENYAQIKTTTVDSSPSFKRVANANVNNTVPSSLLIVKSVQTPLHEINTDALLPWMNFRVGLRNGSTAVPLSELDIIDILPFNGDGVSGSFTFTPQDGTTVDRNREPATEYDGTFEFAHMSFDDNNGSCTGTPEYWFTNSAGPLDISPENSSNSIPGGATNWCQGTEDGPAAGCGFDNSAVTAVRVRGMGMPVSTTCFLNMTFATTGNTDGNIYSNTAGAKADGVTNAVLSNTVPAEVFAGSIGDLVWHDMNNNGQYDAGEELEGVTVKLTPPAAVNLGNGPGVAVETQTDANGNYLFENLYEGDGYTVEVITNTLPALLQEAGVNTVDPDGGSNSSSTVNLGADEDNLDQDFGYFVPASVGSRVWNDTDGDGIQDAGESGRAGVTVTLFDSAGNQLATTTTDGNGDYSFNELVTGDYYVVFDKPAGLVFSQQDQGGDDALDSDANTTTGQTAIFHLDPGENDPDWDAGVTPPASIGNRVWNDVDTDGIQDADEAGVDGVTVTLYDGAGNQVAQTTTAGGGNYSFTNLTPGDYSVGFSDLPNNHVFTDQDVDNDDTVDSDVDTGTGRTVVTHLDPDENDTSWDAGIYEPASLGNFVWHDADGDGVQDPGETGVGGVTVTIFDADGNEVAHTTTAGDGSYNFTGLKPGTYTVSYTDLPDGYVFSPQNAGGDDATDSNPGSNGTTASITLAPGANNTTIDAGIYHPVSLGSRVWMDENADGIQDADEPGIAGVTVALLDENGAPVTDPNTGDPITATTDADGNYLFADLDPGNYSVLITPPAWQGLLQSPVQVANAENNNNTDSNIASTPAEGAFQSGVITLTSGGEPTNDGDADNNTNLSVDFGLVQPASVGNFIWLDENSDGIQDAGEPGVANVTVQLKDSNGNVIAETVTDSNGGYLFTEVPPGDYFVAVDSATLPAGMEQTPLTKPGADFGNQDQSGEGYSVHLGSGEENLTADFGYNYSPNNNMGALGDRIWVDSNGDGVQDDGEPGVSGAEVTLYSAGPDGLFGTADDVAEATTTTDANGNYIFDNLAPGAYTVEVTNSNAANYDILGADYNQTGDPDHFGADSSTAPAGTSGDNRSTQPIVIAPGDTFINADFGYQPQDTAPVHDIGSTIWLDANRDGVQDDGEPGIPGVVIGLKDAEGNFIATTTTDENGEYLFKDLPDGEYTVVIIDSNNVLGELDPTYDADSLLVDPDEKSVVTLAGADNLDQDFGYTPKSPNTGTGMIGDTIFLDRDGNGTPDEGEGLEGVVVNLRDANGDIVGQTTTDENGNYFFGGLPAGDYTVEVDQTTLPEGVSNTVDPDDGDDSTAAVTLADGEINLDQDFGYTAVEPGSIGNQVFNDTNADGIYQPDGVDGIAGTDDDETPIEGVTLDLYQDTNGNGLIDPDEPKIGSTVTDANGNYLFEGLPAGDYNVKVTDEDGKLGGLWHSEGAGDTNDNSQEDHYAVTLPAGGSVDTADFGYYSQPGSLGDRVWNDVDGNGLYDPAVDSGLEGVTVYLDIVYPDGTTTTLQTVTDSEGLYEFPNLLLDEDFNGIGNTYGDGGDEPSHTVRVDEATLPEGLVSTWPVRGSNTDTTDVGGNATDEDDVDMGSDNPAGEPGFPPMGSADSANDFGYFIPSSIGNTIWHDIDNDGVVDPGEGLAGVTVTLTPPADVDLGNGLGQPVEVVTGPNGEYSFEGLPPGDYTVVVKEDDLPPELQGFNTVDPDGGNDSTATVSLGVGEDNVDQNFAYFHPSSIGNYVWDDSNGNGIQDPEESGHEGITVKLLDGNGNPVMDPIRPGVPYVLPTGPNGEYLFENLVAGEYQVEFVLPSNNNFTTANSGDDAADSDANPSTGRATVVLGPSESDLTIDAGLVGPGINIEKSTNGQDADVAPGVNVNVGDAITWTYLVTNTGNVTLTGIAVTDDKIGSINCPSTTLTAGATMTCTANGTAVAGQYANTGSVVATPPTGEAVVDTDTSHYIAISPEPAIDIEKYTNGDDADTGSGPIIAVGDPVTWTYVVTNTGNVELENIIVSDDKVDSISCPLPPVLGDHALAAPLGIGNILHLNPGESITCTATGIAVAGQYTNTGSVTGTPVGGGSSVTDTDQSHYLGSEDSVPFASVDIEKSTNGVDADNAPGPRIKKDEDLMWTYVVTNTGQVDLINVTVTDDKVADTDIHCPDDGNTDNRITTLPVGVSVICTAEGVVEKGPYMNIGTVVGTPPEGHDVTDTDKSHYFGQFFFWPIFMPAIINHCQPIPDFCYMIADGDNEGSNDAPLFKYTFDTNKLELVNRLGVANVESIVISLDGQTVYATNDGIFGTIDETVGIEDSFSPMDPSSPDAGLARGELGLIRIRDIDGLAFDPKSGILYASNRLADGVVGGQQDLLIQLNPETGKIIPDAFGSGIDYVVIDAAAVGASDIDDIAIDPSGDIYGIAGTSGGAGDDHLVLIDSMTGAVTDQGPLHLANDKIQDMEGLTLYNNKTLFGTTGLEFGSQGTSNSLFKVEKDTGVTTFVTRLDKNFGGYVPGDFEAIECLPICK
jgi:protocatechuate 3,4-dioxygenase beta subunit